MVGYCSFREKVFRAFRRHTVDDITFKLFRYRTGYLTWEWKTGIRSYIYPLIIATVYWPLRVFHLDSRFLVVREGRGPNDEAVQQSLEGFRKLSLFRC